MSAMEKLALVKLSVPVEAKVCKALASQPAVAVCHPLQGQYHLLLVLKGEAKDVNAGIRALKGTEGVAEIDVRDRKDLDFGKLGPEQKRKIRPKLDGRGRPFVVCPNCGNESTAVCAECGNSVFPSADCPECPSHRYFCSVCGSQMRHSH